MTRRSSALAGFVGRALALAPITAAIVAARMVEIGHGFGDRAWIVLTLFAVAGAAAALVVFGMALLPPLAGRPRLRGLFVALALPAATLAAGAACFAVHDRLLLGNIDDLDGERGYAHVLFWSLGSAVYLFATAGPRYLLLWPALAIGLMAAALDAWSARRGAGPTTSGSGRASPRR